MERQEKIVSRLGFIGRERDFESDYFALGARMCDAETGRFLSVDLLFESFDAHTPYHYAYNSPIKYKDPSGLMTISDVETGKQILNALYGEKQQWLDIEIGDPGGFDEEQSNWDNLYFQDNYELDPWDYLSTGALYLSYGGGGGSEENEENTNKESEPVNEGKRTGEESGETENGKMEEGDTYWFSLGPFSIEITKEAFKAISKSKNSSELAINLSKIGVNLTKALGWGFTAFSIGKEIKDYSKLENPTSLQTCEFVFDIASDITISSGRLGLAVGLTYKFAKPTIKKEIKEGAAGTTNWINGFMMNAVYRSLPR